jgi:hypothetical protein
MKVYELINELSKCPAGADVEFARLMTLAEFTSCPVADNIDGADAYRVAVNVRDVDVVNETTVALYM